MEKKSVRRIALIDISKDFPYISEDIVSASYLDTKENRLLNKRLGIKNINYKGNYKTK